MEVATKQGSHSPFGSSCSQERFSDIYKKKLGPKDPEKLTSERSLKPGKEIGKEQLEYWEFL